MIGARRDYDVAEILHNENMLERLIIDGYYNTTRYPGLRLFDKILPHQIVNTYKKYDPEIAAEKIISSWQTSFKFKAGLYLNKTGDYYKHQIKAYKALADLAIQYIKGSGTEETDIYGFDTASVELFSWVRKNKTNSRLVLEQCVACRTQQIKMHTLFKQKFGLPNADKMIQHCTQLRERELNEWHLADRILVPSDFVRKGLADEGVTDTKIKLVPYGYDSSVDSNIIRKNIDRKHFDKNKRITILFAGNDGYRKGLHDLIDISAALKDENVIFKIAGKIDLHFVKQISTLENVVFLGKLSKQQLIEEYNNADIFFLPSYLEGSALVTYEAMSWGLPIVTTFESGSIARDAYDGFIMDAGDKDKMTARLQQLINDTELRHSMAANALQTVTNYSLDNYKNNLLKILTALN